MTTKVEQLGPELARIYRASSGRILASLVNDCKDFDLAEDALQTAWLKANENWNQAGLPANPQAWLYTVAKHSLIDHYRATNRSRESKQIEQVAAALTQENPSEEGQHTIPDERLKLIFTCCHPALNQQSQVALTLRTLCGLTTREIARAYLTSETTLQQRLVRAKQKIRKAGIAYREPTAAELPERLDAVAAVIYLIYNESYSAFEGQTLSRTDLANEAIRLARLLHKLLPQPSVAGLLALMLLHQAREPARSSASSAYVTLETQDRSLWNQRQISEGRTVLLGALAQGQPEKYQLQAAISALHAEAESWATTDWAQIVLLYATLYNFERSPIVKLNGLVALANSGQVSQALEQLLELEPPLKDYQPFYAAQADMQISLKQLDAAADSLKRAIALSRNTAEQEFLLSRLDGLS